MSNKKSRKLVNIMLSAMMLLGINATEVTAQTTEYGKNGVAYILLSSDFATPGVYRLNDYDGKISEQPWRLYTLNGMQGKKASGLAANQNNQVFLLTTNTGGEFADAEPGWLPTGIKFDENSSIYLAAAKPDEGGAKDYIRSGCPHISNNTNHTGTYWKRNLNIAGTTYQYAVQFGGPTAVRFLNGVSGTGNQIGTPIWDGSYWPQSTSNSAALKHPTDDRKIILPSHFGALSYYLYGTKNEPAIQGLCMDGSDGRDRYIFTDANGAGVFTGDSKHGSRTMFGCIVKRIYQKRENSLDLYAGNDRTTTTTKPTDQSMSRTQADVLKTVDVKVRESYGKLCGDNCIDGGELPGNKPIETALSTVTVVTSTNGNRYGFNPLGNTNGGNSSGAALRVVNNSGTSVINTSTDSAGQNFNTTNITNATYLASKGITPVAMKTIGVSSNFSTANSTSDYIYGSDADRFVVQDNWWGKGGVAYEYYEGDETKPGKIVKLDYVDNTNPTPEELGDLTGDVDAIAIDGDGYLYALKTEQTPTDAQMMRVSVNANTLSVDSTSYSQNPDLPTFNSSDFTVSLSGWRRDISTTSNGETINNGYIDVAEGQQRPGDYKVATLKQRVYKSVKRYPQGTGSLGTEEPRGQLFAGYDTWTNNLKQTSTGVTWDYAIWREEEGTKTSAIPAELAVVNVADSPITIEGTEKHYVIALNRENTDYETIEEDNSLTFKVEGYKPKVGDKQRYFREIGDINNELKGVKLNSIPAEDGSYAHDENGDGLKSGFPSNMFEAVGKDTIVKWTIAQVEDTEAVSLLSPSSAKIIRYINEGTSGEGDDKSITAQFKEPGRYIIQATVTYNYFNNFGQAARPSDLTCSTMTFVTEPLLINVYSKSLNLDKSPSYITNINMVYNNNKNTYGVQNGSKSSGSDFDCIEGPVSGNEGKFGDLTISFDAQFFGEEQVDDGSAGLLTYDGIGVWDYNYYKNLYTQAVSSLPGISEINIPSNKANIHVYNYKDNSGITSCYDPTVYNPGKSKVRAVSGTFEAGTAVRGDPDDLDFEFIQYALYLRPVTPNGKVTNIDPQAISYDEDDEETRIANQFNRNKGAVIAKGTFKNAKRRSLGRRKYEVSLTIENIDSKINIPRDPCDYTLDLEIVYPRVTWLNNDLGANLNDNKSYFSSIVPYTEAAHAGPVHILSNLRLDGIASNNIAYNQNSKLSNSPNGEKLYYDKHNNVTIVPYFTVCVRDKEKPELKRKPQNLPVNETTGEISGTSTFNYTVTDNNPFLTFNDDLTNTSAPTSHISIQDAINATKVYIQHISNNMNFSSEESNKEFSEASEGIKSVTVSPTDDSINFYATDSWKLTLDYTLSMNPLNNDFAPAEFNTDNSYKENENLELENWIGSLSYTITGKLFDGYGKNSNNTPHYIYLPSLSTLAGYPYTDLTDEEENESVTSVCEPYLQRFDNDPPSIEVEMVSQSDNRRWVFQLIEGINDGDNCPNSVDKLAKSQLKVTRYTLDKGEATQMGKVEVDGSTNFYNGGYHDLIGNDSEQQSSGFKPSVTVTEAVTKPEDLAIALPTVRRAARLLVNVKILDNCGFKPLGAADIEISGEGMQRLKQDIKRDASHEKNGNIISDFNNKPRGVFVVDMPMKVSDNQPQMKIKVYCKDHAGNERELVIPFNVAESTFETRVLETKEERQ